MKPRRFDNTPEADVIVNYINGRFKQGLGTNILIIGLSGTGKSSTSQRIGEIVQQSESRMKDNVQIFISDSLIDLIEAIQKAKEGDIVVIEEVSVLFSSRRAMSKENVSVGKIFDTIRKKRLCLISNAPLWCNIEKNIRGMAHILIQTLNILKTEGVVISKFYRLQTNPQSGKTYMHTMSRKGKDVNLMITKMPSKERWDAYEEQKDKFMDELYEDLKQEQLSKKKKKDKEQGKSIKSVKDLTERELQVHTLCNVKGMNLREAGEKLGLTFQRVHVILKNVDKKSKIMDNLKQFPKKSGGFNDESG